MFSPESVRAVTDQIQMVVVVVAVLMLLVPVSVAVYRPRLRGFAILPVFVAVPTLVFYIFALSDTLPSPWGNFFSVVLRLFTLVIILGSFITTSITIIQWMNEEREELGE